MRVPLYDLLRPRAFVYCFDFIDKRLRLLTISALRRWSITLLFATSIVVENNDMWLISQAFSTTYTDLFSPPADMCSRIEYVGGFKNLFLTEVNAVYTYDTHQFEALLICRQMMLFS